MNERIDVLAVMRLAERNLRGLGVRGNALEIESATEVVAELIGALREARRWIGDGDMSDGIHRSIWTPAYAAAVDQVDSAIARAGGAA